MEHPAPLLNIFMQMELSTFLERKRVDLGRETDAPGCQPVNVVDSAFRINSGEEKIAEREGGAEEMLINPPRCSLIESFLLSCIAQ